MSHQAKNDEPVNHTLDPQNWQALRQLGHRMVDDMLQHFESLRDKPAWQPMPPSVTEALVEPLPLTGEGEERVYEQFLRNVLPYSNGNLHPRFFGWVQGNGFPFAMLADMLATGLNPHLAGFNQAPARVEQQVVDWLTEAMGLPAGTSGILTSGGSMANLIGLTVARHARAGFDVQAEGLRDQAQLVVYCATETHGWAGKSVELLGIGNRHLRQVPVDDQFRMDPIKLRQAIATDRAAGLRPLCVIGTAGTVNTGAVDDLNALADICEEQGLWFHVDGAFGALVRFSPKFRHLVDGLARADSLAFDLHKWMYFPFEVGCVLVKDGEAHRDTFAMAPSYLAASDRGVIAGGLPFAERGIELTRNFKALKVWMGLKAYGLEAFTRIIEQNIDQVSYLARRIEEHPELQLLAPVPMNIACFRYRPTGMSKSDADALNREILLRLQEGGIAVPSSTLIGGEFALRVANTNHRCRHSTWMFCWMPSSNWDEAWAESGSELFSCFARGFHLN